jgi:hypothetical protein
MGKARRRAKGRQRKRGNSQVGAIASSACSATGVTNGDEVGTSRSSKRSSWSDLGGRLLMIITSIIALFVFELFSFSLSKLDLRGCALGCWGRVPELAFVHFLPR